MKRRLCVPCAFLLAAALFFGVAGADETAEKGRQVFEENKDAVVTVRVVVSISFGGEEQENESWANGVILDETGLTVLSLTTIDPFQFFSSMGMGGGRTDVSSEVVLLRIILPDGEEVPGEVVLRDKDLDLAFVRPTDDARAPFPHVDLDRTARPEMLQQVCAIMQLGEVTRRAHAMLVTRVEAVVEKPRPYYVLGDHRSDAVISSPVFDLDGGFVGVGAMRGIRTSRGPTMGDNVLTVVVPAEDIIQGMEQAPEQAEETPPAPEDGDEEQPMEEEAEEEVQPEPAAA